MKIVNYDKISDKVLRTSECVNGITFLSSEQNDLIIETAKDADRLKQWFDRIGIKYENIDIIGSRFVYKVGDKQLDLSDLSSGEKYILYLMACKQVNKEIIAQGLFERLGSRLEKVVLENFADYDALTVVVYNALLPKEFKPYFVEEIRV